MNLRHLRYFLTVAEQKNFRRAAEFLHVSQPALTRQVQLLEDDLGVELLERTPRGVEVTEAGASLMRDAARILQSVAEAAERTKQVATGQAGTLFVGLTYNCATQEIVLDCFREFARRHPGVELAVQGMDSISQIDALRRETIDAGFVLGYRDGEAGFENCKLHEQTLMLAVLENHPYAMQEAVTLADLRDQPLLCIPRRSNPVLYDAITSALLAGGVVPRFVKEYTPGAIILSMVSLGLGLGLVLSKMPWRIPTGIVLKPIRDLSLSLDLHLVWRRGRRSEMLQHFIDAVSDTKAAAEQKSFGGGTIAQDRALA